MQLKRKSISDYSANDRRVLGLIFFLLSAALFWLAINVLQNSLVDYQLNKRMADEGLTTVGTVTGFQYIKYTGKYSHTSTGDYPVVSVELPQGKYTFLSNYQAPILKAKQAQLLGQRVDVLYLAEPPHHGRVQKWQGDGTPWLLFLGLCLFIPALFVLYAGYKAWPKAVEFQ